jgi:hypothetical protein
VIMSVMWDPGILGDDVPTANCRGCGTGIRRGPSGFWQDVNGVTVCFRQRPGDSSYVFHEPMPEGMRGAPE